jgi:hypothetical protein
MRKTKKKNKCRIEQNSLEARTLNPKAQVSVIWPPSSALGFFHYSITPTLQYSSTPILGFPHENSYGSTNDVYPKALQSGYGGRIMDIGKRDQDDRA